MPPESLDLPTPSSAGATTRPNRRETLGLVAGTLALGTEPALAAEEIAAPSFTLLLVNDIYLMGEVEGRGGFARLNAIVKAERARGVPMLYCHAGDCLSPSLMSGFDKGAHVVELLNLAPPDAFVPGNHEFDFGPQVFTERMASARFPVLAANLRDAEGQPLPGIRDSLLVTLGGARIGLVGIALAATPEKAQSGDLRFGPEIETRATQAEALRQAGAEIVVGLAHVARVTDEAIQRAGIVDILLSGHDHDLYLRCAASSRSRASPSRSIRPLRREAASSPSRSAARASMREAATRSRPTISCWRAATATACCATAAS